MASLTVFMDMERGRNFVDHCGEKFGRLTIVEYAGRWGQGQRKWKCRCECGNYTTHQLITLSSGNAKSCGCLRDELASQRARIHGHAATGPSKTYAAWNAMKRRCTNEKSPYFKNYGGRGITVCERWNSFEAFLADMGIAPKGSSLERVNNNGNYEPSNCRWATKLEQDNNRRTCVWVTFNQTTQTVAQWERSLGFKTTTLRGRLRKGWSVERALTQPVRPRMQ